MTGQPPEEMGKKTNAWNEIDGMMRQSVEDGVFPDSVVLVDRNGVIDKK